MAFKAEDVIAQLENKGVKMDPGIKAQLIQHLSHPELVEKIKNGAKQWRFPETNVALTSAIDFLGAQGVIDPAFKTALHTINSMEMKEIHKAGSLRSRAAAFVKEAVKKKAPLLRRRRAA